MMYRHGLRVSEHQGVPLVDGAGHGLGCCRAHEKAPAFDVRGSRGFHHPPRARP
jgi:hypothetical protein